MNSKIHQKIITAWLVNGIFFFAINTTGNTKRNFDTAMGLKQ
jgi:hypothetical protein